MGYMDVIRNLIEKFKSLFRKRTGELQPRDILSKLILELEYKKKLGIEENAFVPNVFAVYLCPVDYEEMSPLLSGIRDQLKNKLMERIKKSGYKILSASMSLEIREDGALQRNQVVIESSFLKERTAVVSSVGERERVIPLSPILAKEECKGGTVAIGRQNPAEAGQNKAMTRIIEDKKTRLIDNTKVELEILDGENKGELIKLKEGEYTFGRGKDATILIKDKEETISRVHFKLFVKKGKVGIKDLNSANGTKVNDIEIEEAELKKGDTIAAGKVMLRVA
jgi:hypothetical protein